jgi:hypothetical protein
MLEFDTDDQLASDRSCGVDVITVYFLAICWTLSQLASLHQFRSARSQPFQSILQALFTVLAEMSSARTFAAAVAAAATPVGSDLAELSRLELIAVALPALPEVEVEVARVSTPAPPLPTSELLQAVVDSVTSTIQEARRAIRALLAANVDLTTRQVHRIMAASLLRASSPDGMVTLFCLTQPEDSWRWNGLRKAQERGTWEESWAQDFFNRYSELMTDSVLGTEFVQTFWLSQPW